MITALVLTAGCGDSTASQTQPDPSAQPPATSAPPPVSSSDAAVELAGRAAAAADRSFRAGYLLRREKADSDVEVTVTMAADGTWQVEVPGGARGGKSDVTIAWNKDAYFQCSAGKTDRCVPIAKPDEDLPEANDPMVQHVFTDWLESLRERANPLSVAFADKPKDLKDNSSCYSVEHNSVTVAAPVPAGLYCLRADGMITAANASFGKLRLDGAPSPGPETVELPDDVDSDASPLPTSPPPSPSPSKTPKPSTSKTPKPSTSPSGGE